MKKITIFFFALNFLLLSSQNPKNANHWFWGKGNKISFNINSINYENNPIEDYTESTTSYSDSQGNLIVYYNNTSVYNKFHNVIINGNNIKGYFSSSQSSLILKHNQNDSMLFLITNIPCNVNLEEGIYLTKIKYKNNILTVVDKNIKLNNSATESLNAVMHKNGNDIWIISHQCDNNIFDMRLLTKNSILECSNNQTIGSVIDILSVGASYLKFSPSGKFLVHSTGRKGTLELYKFNNERGILSDAIVLSQSYSSGIEFSSNEKYLYTHQAFNNYYSQLTINKYIKDSILNSKKILYSNNTPMFGNSLQMGSDKRIYFSMRDSVYLGSIAS